MQHTMIEWARNPDGSPGYSWNPITGCLNGCPYCYARRLANTRLRNVYLNNKELASCPSPTRAHVNDPFYPRFWPEKLREIDRRARVLRKCKAIGDAVRSVHPQAFPGADCLKARGIFTCNMADLFGIGVPKEWTCQVLEAIRYDPSDRFYLLTKQPQNLAAFSPFPPNVWLGVSVTGPEHFEAARRGLGSIAAEVKYLSLEPLLGDVAAHVLLEEWEGLVNWVIIGAQTKPAVWPGRAWVESIEGACATYGIPVFEKDSLKPLFPERELRREWPK